MRNLTIPKLHPKDGTTVSALETTVDEHDCHVYLITGFRHTTNKAYCATKDEEGPNASAIRDAVLSRDALHVIGFQQGDPATRGVNGITMEVLLAVVADRLERMQSGPWACAENATALTSARAAIDALQSRGRRLQGTPVDSPTSASPDDIQALVRQLIALRPSLSYNESYAGEPPGLVKSDVTEWERKGGYSTIPPTISRSGA